MYQIVGKKSLNPTVTQMEILAPFVAKKALPGQFIILRVSEDGERIPLTIAGYDREKGTITIIFQIVGAGTQLLNYKEVGVKSKHIYILEEDVFFRMFVISSFDDFNLLILNVVTLFSLYPDNISSILFGYCSLILLIRNVGISFIVITFQ